MKPGDLQLKTTPSRLKCFISSERKTKNQSTFKLLQILHILCFTDVNSETKTSFFLVKFLNSTLEYMNQKRQVFEFFIQGALRELISHDRLVKFGPIAVEIKLVKPIKLTLVFSHTSITHLRYQITTGFFYHVYERFNFAK